MDDITDEESALEISRSLLTIEENRLTWRLDDSCFRTGAIAANLSNLLYALQFSALVVKANLAVSFVASSPLASSWVNRWKAAAFFPVNEYDRNAANDNGFLVLSGIAISIDAFARFSIIGQHSDRRELPASLQIIQRIIAKQESAQDKANRAARAAARAAIERTNGGC